MQTAIQLFCRGKDLWIKWKKIGRIRVFPTFHKFFHKGQKSGDYTLKLT